MKSANMPMLWILAVGLFLSGFAFAVLPGFVRLGLVLAGVMCACTVAAINEICQAGEEITRKIEKHTQAP